MQKLMGLMRRCIDDYDMIQEGDRIAVGVSGGKDSLVMLQLLAGLRKYFHKPFQLEAITIDMGLGMDYSGISQLCRELDVPYHIIKTEIGPIIFEHRKEKNPCSLCAKMRRGSLHQAAKSLGCNKVALGHHYDDAVETFMMNLFFEGRLGCFSPVTYLSNRDITLIRPMIYATEKDVRYFTNRQNLPIVHNPCPEDKATERENMKKLLSELEKSNKGVKHRIFHAICKGNIDGFKFTGRYPDAGEIEE